MRCCLLTLHGQPPAVLTLAVQGSVVFCDHCSESMIFSEGAWEWNHPKTELVTRFPRRQAS